MTWRTPKTDWEASWDAFGNYTGDYFNVQDYIRITENFMELQDMALELFGKDISRLYQTTNYTHFYRAAEINELEYSVDDLYAVYPLPVGDKHVYSGNEPFPDYVEWNRIESAQLAYYNLFNDIRSGLRRLSFTLSRPAFGNR